MIHTGGLAQSIGNLGASLVKNNESRVGMGFGANTNRSLVQSLFQPEPVVLEGQLRCDQEPIPENLHLLKTLARSYFQPEAMNTNAFDIRFYEKISAEEKKNMDP